MAELTLLSGYKVHTKGVYKRDISLTVYFVSERCEGDKRREDPCSYIK